MKTAFIFVPDILDITEIGMLEGFSEEYGDNISFYITNCKIVNSSANTIGYCSEKTPNKMSLTNNDSEWVHINSNNGTISIINQREEYPEICIRYDFKTFAKSEITTYKSNDYGVQFQALASAIKTEFSHRNYNHNLSLAIYLGTINFILFILKVLIKITARMSPLCKYSETAVHLQNNIKNLHSTFFQIKLEKKLSLRAGNVLAAKLLDFAMGILVLYYTLTFEDEIISFVEDSAERIVQGVKQLLVFLMGSPIGLKLNYSFNKTLGSFFLYHLSLWRAFLFSMRPFLHYIFHLLVIPGSLGLTFQIALVEDFVRFSTLHVYCIYVYAARLYKVQVVGLGSLWPLFIGKKYNPLRNRIDSHQYSHHQLFIGTLGFTVLLFLWPTTFLYYSIFTTLRVGLILLGRILMYLRGLLEYLPIYIFLLWIFDSPSLAGAIKMKIEHQKGDFPIKLHATLLKLSLKESISLILPKAPPRLPPLRWSTLIKNLFSAVLL